MADPGETIAAPMGSIGTDRIVFIRIAFPVHDDYVIRNTRFARARISASARAL